MKTKMKLNRSGLFLAICLGLTVFASTVPAEARSTTGWSSWKLGWVSPYTDASCVGESFGAVINNCGQDIHLTFETVIDNGGYRDVYVTGANSGIPFRCDAYAFAGGQITGADGEWVYPGGQTHFRVSVNNGGAMSVYCIVHPQSGVATLAWIP